MRHARSSTAVLAAAALLAGQAHAQPARDPAAGSNGPATCTDVQVGSAESYNCINAQLGALAHNTQRPSSADAPLTASSPSNEVGTFNESATRERLGPNFGKSGAPYRPAFVPPPTFGSPR